jgi:hypothetical protein
MQEEVREEYLNLMSVESVKYLVIKAHAKESAQGNTKPRHV